MSYPKCSIGKLSFWAEFIYTVYRCIRQSCVYNTGLSPTPNGHLAKQHFKCGNVLELCNRVAFAFYSRQSHILFHPILVPRVFSYIREKCSIVHC